MEPSTSTCSASATYLSASDDASPDEVNLSEFRKICAMSFFESMLRDLSTWPTMTLEVLQYVIVEALQLKGQQRQRQMEHANELDHAEDLAALIAQLHSEHGQQGSP